MVSFRLSPAEYTRLAKVCEQKGVRSISGLARVAMSKLAAQDIVELDPLWEQVREIRTQVQSLSQELDRVSRALEARDAARASA